MTHEEHETIITDILSNLGDQGKVSELLNNLREDYTTTLTNVNTLSTSNADLLKNNESLRNVNNKFMIRLGNLEEFNSSNNTNVNSQFQQETQQQQNQEPKLSYDNLFENGVLK